MERLTMSLLINGQQPFIPTVEQQNEFLNAAETGNEKVVCDYLAKGIDSFEVIRGPDSYQRNALQLASDNFHINVMDRLLMKKEDREKLLNKSLCSARTPLNNFCYLRGEFHLHRNSDALTEYENKAVIVIKKLLNGANVLIPNYSGLLSIHSIAYRGSVKIAKLLLDHEMESERKKYLEEHHNDVVSLLFPPELALIIHEYAFSFFSLQLQWQSFPDKNTPLTFALSGSGNDQSKFELTELFLRYGADPRHVFINEILNKKNKVSIIEYAKKSNLPSKIIEILEAKEKELIQARPYLRAKRRGLTTAIPAKS